MGRGGASRVLKRYACSRVDGVSTAILGASKEYGKVQSYIKKTKHLGLTVSSNLRNLYDHSCCSDSLNWAKQRNQYAYTLSYTVNTRLCTGTRATIGQASSLAADHQSSLTQCRVKLFGVRVSFVEQSFGAEAKKSQDEEERLDYQ